MSTIVKFLYRVATLAALATPLMCATLAHCADYATPLVWHGGLQTGDYLSSVGGVEGNPLVARVGLKPAKIGAFALTYAADIGVQKASKGKKWPVWVYRGLLGVGYGWVIRHNTKVR
jgi:hypothetical protein